MLVQRPKTKGVQNHGLYSPYMGVSRNQETLIQNPNSRALMMHEDAHKKEPLETAHVMWSLGLFAENLTIQCKLYYMLHAIYSIPCQDPCRGLLGP